MSSGYKNVTITVLVVLVGILGFKVFISDLLKKKDNSAVDSTIVVERIRKVMKLITVEGHYSEIMNYRDFSYIDFPGFRKDAMLKVDAKVSVGYNLENMDISTDEKAKTITIRHMPKPEILSVDTDIKFENLSTGIFTGFSEAELSKLNKMAKDNIRKKALSMELIRQAEEQKNDLFDLLFYMAKGNGYSIVVEGSSLTPKNYINQ
ncbi:MAG: DUF4230 domain-containing protein [Sphingobacteriales bacterium]|nr:DUF4230 domain-containing protein [Sphingobacteriales bacterium]